MSFKCTCGKECDDNWAGCPWCLTKKPEFDYRLLKIGETIQKGDEYWSDATDSWRSATSVGSVGESITINNTPYRRRIKKEDTYYTLRVNDTILASDETSNDRGETWRPVSQTSVGDRWSDFYYMMRRKVAVYKDINND